MIQIRESYLRRKIREVLLEADFIRKRTGQRLSVDRPGESPSGGGASRDLGSEVLSINPDRLIEGTDLPVILAMIDDVKKLDAAGEEIEDDSGLPEPTKFFAGFARSGFREKYFNSLEVNERAELRSFSMSYGDVTIGDLEVEVVPVRLSDIFGTFDAGRLDMLKRQELAKIKAERDAIKRLPREERTKEVRERYNELKEEFAIAKKKYEDLASDLDSSQKRSVVKKDLQQLQRVYHSSDSGQYLTSTTARQAMAIALRPFDLVTIDKEIKESTFLADGGERQIITMLNARRYFDTLETANYSDVMSSSQYAPVKDDTEVRRIIKKVGGSIRDDLDYYSSLSRKEAKREGINFCLSRLEEEIRDTLEILREEHERGVETGLSALSWSFYSYLDDIARGSSYSRYYSPKITSDSSDSSSANSRTSSSSNLRGMSVVDADDIIGDMEQEQDSETDSPQITGDPLDYRSYTNFREAICNIPMEKAIVMFQSAMLESHRLLIKKSKDPEVYQIHFDPQVDASGKLVGLNDEEAFNIYADALKNFLFMRDTLAIIVGKKKQREAQMSPVQKERLKNPQLAPDHRKRSGAHEPWYQKSGPSTPRKYRN